MRFTILLTVFHLLLVPFDSLKGMEVFGSSAMRQLSNDISNGKYGKVSSVLILKGNKVIFERYYGFSQAGTIHPVSSVTKSITALSVGICIDKGYIASVNDPISKYLPDYLSTYKTQPHKAQITIKHLLNQTSGFDWDEWNPHYSYAGNQLVQLAQYQGNWVDYIMNLPLKNSPGTVFCYNSGNSELLKEIVCRVSGTDFFDFINQNLFAPLNITAFYWESYSGNRNPAWGGLSLTTRDMAKFGSLILNNGMFGGKQIVSANWIQSTFQTTIRTDKARYGLHWWIGEFPDSHETYYYAAGYGDQYVYIAPQRNLVVAVNALNFTDFKFEQNITEMFYLIVKSITNS